MQHCPCGSNKIYNECCEIYISGKQNAPTPEALMRSRYTAYTKADIDYIQATMRGEATRDFNTEVSKLWAQRTKWLGLEILNAPVVSTNDTIGFVEFIAHYIFNHKKESIHEISEFHRDTERWYYVNGNPGSSALKLVQKGKIGRNDNCPCGSNKKYKKCCGN